MHDISESMLLQFLLLILGTPFRILPCFTKFLISWAGFFVHCFFIYEWLSILDSSYSLEILMTFSPCFGCHMCYCWLYNSFVKTICLWWYISLICALFCLRWCLKMDGNASIVLQLVANCVQAQRYQVL